MTTQSTDSQMRKSFHMIAFNVCMVALLAGCSAQLRTTTITGHDVPKVQVAKLQPEQLVEEQVQPQPLPEDSVLPSSTLDIPVEEPVGPVIRPSTESEIFSTSKTRPDTDGISQPDLTPEADFSNEGEQAGASLAQARQSVKEDMPSAGVPSISFEPELPALPNLDGNGASTEVVSEEPQIVAKAGVETDNDGDKPVSSVDEEPIQIAKVMPQERLDREITTEDLEVMLSDVFFDYDQFAIREDAVSLLEANAKLLTEKFAGHDIIIEGHCDQRGTQSYNIVLGERRAKAVQGFLKDLGIPEEKLQIVSFGKEKPFCTEQTEACWQENRRGHFVIKK